LGAAGAVTQALPAYVRCAEKNVQIHGGIGYTWEHDAHLHLRRAMTLAAVFGASENAPHTVTMLAAEGAKVDLAIDLPPEAEQFREEARAFRARYDLLPQEQRRAALIETGYLLPHWPKPYGRGAGVVEQLVIDEELDGVEQANLGIGSWVVLTLVQHGTPDQLERWIAPSLRGELYWCQLFSEPNAGSDAAAIQTRATRVDGGWLVNGQKVWTSGAERSNRGLATVRTDVDAPKHAGVTTVAVDMHAKGVEVRPLREITGETLFNEVFFDDVFVPDDDVVGDVNQGWTVARATLGNERVSIGGNKGGLDIFDADDLVPLMNRYAANDVGVARDVGTMLAEQHGMTALNLRHVARSLAGGPPGPEGNVTKLLSAEHASG
jgi:alkylation response protein AidB-like acyl-CoA dehydrogenase